MLADALSINDLANGHVLKRVLPMICDKILDSSFCIEEYREMVGLAAVSHRWHELLQPYFYRTVIAQRIEVKNKSKPWAKSLLKRKKRKAGPRFRWQSNVENVIAAGKSHRTREIRIVQRTSGTMVTLEDVLRGLGFDAGDWSGVTTIRFIGAFTQYEPFSDKDTQSACGYFLKTFPNVTELDCTQAHCAKDPADSFLASLTRWYIPQLHTIYIDSFLPSSPLDHYPEHVTRVLIKRSLYPYNMNVHQFLASALKYLYIDHIQDHFNWERFLGADEESTEFTNLEELVLKFSYWDQPPIISSPLIRKMRFPSLKRLTISRSFYAISELYPHFIASPLQSLCIREEMDKLRPFDTAIIRSVTELDVTVVKNTARVPDGWGTVFADLLGTVSTVKKARLTGTPFIFPEHIHWLYLEQLTIIPETIAWSSVVKVISELPLLLYLEVRCIDMEDSVPDLFSLTQSRLVRLDTRLQMVSLGMNGVWSTADRHNLKVLAMCVPSLIKLCVSARYVNEFETFASQFGQSFSVAPIT
ncbi:hypothetical protein DL89DRAFT_266823 [Linderina pennispora]|uniref:F-box domain-containing protein n=1 Tax=Linderina pennispora TaxID=61395 RepID=A0A1Y1WAQ4_9FUNG|nr:uncharacterized protein DL89DRAFT_266823 [Linderina pennispora]ORX70640.1 hypothetical protein DL89DRAFT_266823 [Linderina pennispora]